MGYWWAFFSLHLIPKLKSVPIVPLSVFFKQLIYWSDQINVLNKSTCAYTWLRGPIRCFFKCQILIQLVIKLEVCRIKI